MNLIRKIFLSLSVFTLCGSALFLLILTVSGFFFGISIVFFGEKELNGIFFSKTASEHVAEIVIFCVWFFGAGAGFIANIVVLYRIMKYCAGKK